MDTNQDEVLAFMTNLQEVVGRQSVRIIELETLLAMRNSEITSLKNNSEKPD